MLNLSISLKHTLIVLPILLSGCTSSKLTTCQERIDNVKANTQVLADIVQLSSSEMSGRAPTTRGSLAAQQYITERFINIGAQPFYKGYTKPFAHRKLAPLKGVNLVATVAGSVFPEQFIVVSAHYDHLGHRGSTIFYGADDNASGVAMMLDLAAHLTRNPPLYSVLFLATDAEEKGLLGASAFLQENEIDIVLNLNLDMLGRSKRMYYLVSPDIRNKLRVSIESSSNTCFVYRRRHKDRSSMRYVDYFKASDHYAFHKAGIPYVFLSGAIHNDYHLSSDTSDKMRLANVSNQNEHVRKMFGLIEDLLIKQGT